VLFALAMLVGPGEPAEAQGPRLSARRIAGVASALVVDVKDPEASGRIKVRFPRPQGGEDIEVWARVSLPLGGNATGLWALPEVDDEVLVAFEQGDLRQPVVLGSLWNGTEPPPAGSASGHITSPNGLFSISVTDSGIELRGPSVVVRVDAANVQVDAVGTAIRSLGPTDVSGAVVRLNGSGCPPVARVGDLVQFAELGRIVTGSPTVTAC
jgi:phage baseplate assembly protein gpV